MNQDYSLDAFTNAGDAILAFFLVQTKRLLFDKMFLLDGAMHGLIVVAMVITILFFGALLIMGKYGTYEDLWKMFLTASIVSSVTPSIYFNYITLPVVNISNGLTIFLSDANYETPFAAVTSSFGTVIYMGWQLIQNGGVTDLAPVLTGLCVLTIFGAAYILFVIVCVFAAFMLSICMMFGFILLKLMIFKTWRPVIKTWIQSVLKFAMVPVFSTLVVAFSSELVNACMRRIVASRTMNSSLEVSDITGIEFYIVLITGALTVYVLLKSIEMTAEITGGVANDLGGAARAATSASKTTFNAIKLAAKKI